jgi:hypothetical protein
LENLALRDGPFYTVPSASRRASLNGVTYEKGADSFSESAP